MDSQKALQRLIDGNKRYATDQMLNPNRSTFRRKETTHSQNPFAVIVGCSDSRVPPEIIFDQGIGDLFTVRVAGNVIGPVERDSIDFSVRCLGSSLVLVMGHESCGAVTAVYEGQTQDIEEVAKLIEPSIRSSQSVEEAVQANIRAMVSYLKEASFLKKMIEEGKVDIVGAYYRLGKGSVELL